MSSIHTEIEQTSLLEINRALPTSWLSHDGMVGTGPQRPECYVSAHKTWHGSQQKHYVVYVYYEY